VTELDIELIWDIRLSPEDEIPRLVFADWLDEHGDAVRADLLRNGNIPLTVLDQLAAYELGNCRFLPGSYDKRFAYGIAAPVNMTPPRLSWKQYRQMWKTCWRYRKQIGRRNSVVPQVANLIRIGRTPSPFVRQLAIQWGDWGE
jgi:uncharacterized protein (TIGR02996 family)